MKNQFKGSIKRLSEDFISASHFFYQAWYYSFPKKHPDGEPFKFSEWYEQAPVKVSKDGAIVFYQGHAEKIAKKISIFPDEPIKNMAFAELYIELTKGGMFEIDAMQKQDFRALGAISQRYFSLSFLFEHYEETLSFIAEYAPGENPYYILESIRETLSKSANRAIGFWYANSQEVRGFMERDKKMRKGWSEGGRAKGQNSQKKRKEWQAMADKIWKKHPDWSKSNVARQIVKTTGDKWETIRRRIKQP